MERQEIFDKLTEIFQEVMDNDEIVVTEKTCADDIEEWDSLTQIQLVVAIEKALGIKFNSKEITTWNNVGEMVDSVMSK